MTCIVALRSTKGDVIVGADRQATGGWTAHLSAQPKIRDHDGIIVGCAGSVRISQVIDHELDWDDLAMRLHASDDPYTWAVKKLIPAIRSSLGDHAALTVTDGVAAVHESEALIVVHGRIYMIGGDLQVYENAEPYAAIGSGSEIAIGSLWSSPWMADARARVQLALEAAERWNIGVGGPFDLLDQPSLSPSTRGAE